MIAAPGAVLASPAEFWSAQAAQAGAGAPLAYEPPPSYPSPNPAYPYYKTEPFPPYAACAFSPNAGEVILDWR